MNPSSSSPDSERETLHRTPTPTACLIGASFGTDNRGVAALAAGTVNAARHAIPGCRVFLLDYGRTPVRTPIRCFDGPVGVELVNIRFSKRILLRNNIARLLALSLLRGLVPGRVWRNRVLARHPELRAIAEADVVLSIAGGDSFSDIYGMGRFFYVSLPQMLAVLLGKRLVLLPQTLGPFKGFIARRIAAWIMRRADFVYARDNDSLDAARPLVGSRAANRLRFSPDMAFALEAHITDERRASALAPLDPTRPVVGLNVSGLLYMGGYTRNNMFGLKSDHRELVRSLIRMFLESGAQVLLVPHVFGEGEGSESDVVASMQILEELGPESEGRLHMIRGDLDQHEVKALIGGCEFFVGARMHACIAALSQCVPAIGLAYSRKFRGVFDSVGLAEGVVDLRTQDTDSVVAVTSTAFARRAELQKGLNDRVPEVRTSVLHFFGTIGTEWSATPKA